MTDEIVRGCYPEGDDDWIEHAILEVEPGKDRTSVRFDGDWWHAVEPGAFTPAVGMTLRIYPADIGQQVRGVFVDGVCFRYRTPSQQDWKHRLWCAQRTADDAARAERDIPARDARWAALPAAFQARRARFMANNPGWRRDFESYELFTCEEAVKIARRFETADAVRAWAQLADYDEQKARHPELSDEHSGNTFGMACRYAIYWLEYGDDVTKAHGALSPLVGSEEYGDVPVAERS